MLQKCALIVPFFNKRITIFDERYPMLDGYIQDFGMRSVYDCALTLRSLRRGGLTLTLPTPLPYVPPTRSFLKKVLFLSIAHHSRHKIPFQYIPVLFESRCENEIDR
jgi:hypothetical protein